MKNTGVKSEPVYRNVCQFFLQVFIHKVFVFVFGIAAAAGPAAQVNLGSGPFDIKRAPAGEAAALQLVPVGLGHDMFIPL